MNNNKAFSLIELSIVLIIIGLLVAGIVGGANLIRNAKARSFIGELTSYKQAINSFYSFKGRLPGDLNNDGITGYGSEETYDSSSFPAPYDGSDENYSIPSNMTSAFVELWLEKIIDFEPKKSGRYNNYTENYELGGLPSYKVLNELFLHLEYKQDSSSGEYMSGVNNQVLLTSRTYKNRKSVEVARLFKAIDDKSDDGFYNSGHIRGECWNGKKGSERQTDYQEAIDSKGGCWVNFVFLDFIR